MRSGAAQLVQGRGRGRPACHGHRRAGTASRRARQPLPAAGRRARRRAGPAGRAGGCPRPEPGRGSRPGRRGGGRRDRSRPARRGPATRRPRHPQGHRHRPACAPAPTWRRVPATTGSPCARLASTAWLPSSRAVSSMAPTARCAAAPSTRAPPRRHQTPSAARRRTPRPRHSRWQTASAPPPARRWPHSTPSSPPPGRRPAATHRLPTCAAPAHAAAADVERLTGLAANVQADASALAEFGAQHEGWLRERVSLDQDAKNLRTQVAADTRRLQRLRTALDQARGDDPSITTRAARLARLADDLDGLAAQVGTVEQLGDQVAAALQRAEEAALARGLASLEEVAAMAPRRGRGGPSRRGPPPSRR